MSEHKTQLVTSDKLVVEQLLSKSMAFSFSEDLDLPDGHVPIIHVKDEGLFLCWCSGCGEKFVLEQQGNKKTACVVTIPMAELCMVECPQQAEFHRLDRDYRWNDTTREFLKVVTEKTTPPDYADMKLRGLSREEAMSEAVDRLADTLATEIKTANRGTLEAVCYILARSVIKSQSAAMTRVSNGSLLEILQQLGMK
jgi:hypothetical protein